MRYVLDASALLALLNDEPGAERVGRVLPDAIISAVNYAEVGSRLADHGEDSNVIERSLRLIGIEIIPFDARQADIAVRLRAITRSAGLSIGDRACLALAVQMGSIAVTADRAWQNVDPGCKVEFIR